MFRKIKERSILEHLGKDLSGRELSKILGVSRNTVAEVQVEIVEVIMKKILKKC